MKSILPILFFITFSKTFVFSQQVYCSVSVTPSDTTLCIGDSLLLSSISNLVNANQTFNFNSNTLPVGWATTGAPAVGAPCGNNPTNTPYYWAASAGIATPQVTTTSFDVTCGGFIRFDMVYALQEGSSPCEGPDLANEGVLLQYSIDGGITWITIQYYQPDGTILNALNTSSAQVISGAGEVTPFTSWSTFNVPIPLAAQTTNTKFRWTQPNSSGSAYDNWGLDNIIINSSGTPCGASTSIQWNQQPTLNQDSFYHVASNDTTFVCYVYDNNGVYRCQSTPIHIHVVSDNMTYQLIDTTYSFCPTTNPLVAVTNIANSVAPHTFSWSTGSTTSSSTLSTGNAEHDTITYYVTIKNACNYQRYDSVVLIVNKTLNIDSIFSGPATCEPVGWASVVVSGDKQTPSHGLYFLWTSPSNTPGPASSVWYDLSSGWYKITVEDAYCTDVDSVFIDQLKPPIAVLAGTPLQGCSPVEVTFTNTSTNATSYEWNFGDGTIITTSNLDPKTHTFTTSSTVTLTAYSSPSCFNKATLGVEIVFCGCTDPLAINYDPLAVINDGSCIFPTPEVIVPNVFTPNGDGVNDSFSLQVKNYASMELTILNRWGVVVYHNQGKNLSWDGNYNGQQASDGTYFYAYTVNALNGETLSGNGFLQLSHE